MANCRRRLFLSKRDKYLGINKIMEVKDMDELKLAVETLQESSGDVWGVWFLIGAALVFFMQCGFAMVETGFTRAKNAGNIIMKNLMDFCIGTVVFMLLGYSLLTGDASSTGGLFGIPTFDIFTDFANFDWSGFVFNLVFCATAATIVSGAMAERTKFSSYLIYSAVISAIVYPIEAGWVWNADGWLISMGFQDFAGSAAIHTVGGVSALIGAFLLGPRIGKYTKGEDGKIKAHAIPGHSLTLGALGVFILWFGWYGFNGAAAGNVTQLAQIFGTTTIATGLATVVTMAFTWIKNGKPDVSMSLNGSLAGLVAITAGCAWVDAVGAAIIGIVAGVLVVVAVEFIDLKLHIDDPVGAVAVHGANGIWGTIAVGLFCIYEDSEAAVTKGLFYGGGARQLGIQVLGIVAIIIWTAVLMTIVFLLIKKTVGLRVSKAEEIQGLDVMEHGMSSAYADFAPMIPEVMTSTASSDETPVAEAIPVVPAPKAAAGLASDVKMTKVEIICKLERFELLKESLNRIGVMGITVTHVLGCGVQKGGTKYYRGVEVDVKVLPKVKVEVVVSKVPVELVVETARKALYTGNIGDGKIFVYDVENVIKVRTGEEGYDALQGPEDAE